MKCPREAQAQVHLLGAIETQIGMSRVRLSTPNAFLKSNGLRAAIAAGYAANKVDGQFDTASSDD
jgi:hypothetical protein